MSRRQKTVGEATSGERGVVITASPLDPEEALVAALLDQVEGTSLEIPAKRLLLPRTTAAPELGRQEADAAMAAARRSAIALGQLEPGPAVPVEATPEDAVSPKRVNVETADAPPTVRLPLWLPDIPRPEPLWTIVLEAFLTPWRRRAPHDHSSGDSIPRRPRRARSVPLDPPRAPPDPLASTDALDRAGRRLEALATARALAAWREDPRIHEKVAELEARLVGGTAVDLEWDGQPVRIVFGASATLGRTGADIVVQHAGLSRRHLAIAHGEGGASVRDLATTNGTTVDGRRLEGPVPVGGGLDLVLAETIPCAVRPLGPHAVSLEIGGGRAILVAPWSSPAAAIGAFRIRPCTEHARAFLRLTSHDGALALFSRDLGASGAVDLCHGDAIGDGRTVRIRVA